MFISKSTFYAWKVTNNLFIAFRNYFPDSNSYTIPFHITKWEICSSMLLNSCSRVLALRQAVWILNHCKMDWELLLISLLFTAHYFDLNGIIPTYLSCQSCSFLCFWYSVKHPHSSATQRASITCYSRQSTWFCCTWIAHFPFESASILSALLERFLVSFFLSFF